MSGTLSSGTITAGILFLFVLSFIRGYARSAESSMASGVSLITGIVLCRPLAFALEAAFGETIQTQILIFCRTTLMSEPTKSVQLFSKQAEKVVTMFLAFAIIVIVISILTRLIMSSVNIQIAGILGKMFGGCTEVVKLIVFIWVIGAGLYLLSEIGIHTGLWNLFQSVSLLKRLNAMNLVLVILTLPPF